MDRKPIVHKTKYYTDDDTWWIEIDYPFTIDVRIIVHPPFDYFTAVIVGGFSELAGSYTKRNSGCVWDRNVIHINKNDISIESFIKEAMSWYCHNVFICDNRGDTYKALKLCYY